MRARPSGHAPWIFVAGCAVSLMVSGCFLLPMPRDRDAATVEAPAGSSSVDENVEPPVEEPIRERGNDALDEPVDEPEDEPADAPVEGSPDFNGDGQIDDADIEFFRNEFGTFAEDGSRPAADLDGDGAVTLVDFQIFLTLAPGAGDDR